MLVVCGRLEVSPLIFSVKRVPHEQLSGCPMEPYTILDRLPPGPTWPADGVPVKDAPEVTRGSPFRQVQRNPVKGWVGLQLLWLFFFGSSQARLFW